MGKLGRLRFARQVKMMMRLFSRLRWVKRNCLLRTLARLHGFKAEIEAIKSLGIRNC